MTHYCPHTVKNLLEITFSTHPSKVCCSGKVLGTNHLPKMVNHLRHITEILGNSIALGTSSLPEMVNQLGDTTSLSILMKVCCSGRTLGTSSLPEVVNHLGDIISQTDS